MTESVFDRIRNSPGTRLERSAYHADSDSEQEKLSGGVIWKLERSQIFNEVGDEAWEAFQSGDWSRVIEIFESERDAVRDELWSYAEQGLELRRVRVAESPPTPYLQWEMHSHRIFAECGFPIRVLNAERIDHLERHSMLPELMVYGDRVLYQVRYDDHWTPDGATRIDDPTLVREAARAVSELWEAAEPLSGYFEREIAPLATPRAGGGGYVGKNAART